MSPISDAIDEDDTRDLLNRALLLYAVGSVNRGLNRTQVQKMMFCAEKSLRDKSLATPAYRFIRWDHGPFAKDIYDDGDALFAVGAFTQQHATWGRGRESTTEITAHGRAIRDAIVAELEHLPRWSEIRAELDKAAQFVAALSATKAREWSHDLIMKPDHPGVDEMSIHDMQELTVILDPKAWGDAREIDRDLLENLSYTLSLTPSDLDEIDEGSPDRVAGDDLFA